MLRERQFNRETVAIAGTISQTDGQEDAAACEIVDISAGGAKLKLARPIPQGATVHLGLGRLGHFPATVAWSRPPHVGIAFADDPDRMAEIILGLTLYGT